jgi:NADH-quinone oxidoreductase subunit F
LTGNRDVQDRDILRYNPHLSRAGDRAYAMGCKRGYPAIRRDLGCPELREALDENRAGFLGDDILGSGFSAFILQPSRLRRVHICGEDGAARSLEGKEGLPR